MVVMVMVASGHGENEEDHYVDKDGDEGEDYEDYEDYEEGGHGGNTMSLGLDVGGQSHDAVCPGQQQAQYEAQTTGIC